MWNEAPIEIRKFVVGIKRDKCDEAAWSYKESWFILTAWRYKIIYCPVILFCLLNSHI
jgi:hypothetical protein